MARIRTFAGAFLLGVSVLVAGCLDVPTAPSDQIVEPSYGLLDSDGLLTVDEENVTVLTRSVSLVEDEVVSKTIGRLGGTIHLPVAGLAVAFPPNALSSATEITVTAPAGDLVGYHFEPHGLDFDRAVTVSQDLLKTNGLSLDGLSAHYFEGDLEPEVTSLERLALWIVRTLGVFQIDHFSGYVIATN